MTRGSSEQTLQSEHDNHGEHAEKDTSRDDHGKEDNPAPGGSNRDEEKNSGDIPPLPVGLLHPSLKNVRKQAAKKWTLTVLILFCYILCVLSLYWAVLFHVPQNLEALTVAVVNFDGTGPYTGITPLVGPAIEKLAMEQAALPAYSLGYRIESPAQYGGDPLAVRQAVYDEHMWAAIIVSANATALLQQAVAIRQCKLRTSRRRPDNRQLSPRRDDIRKLHRSTAVWIPDQRGCELWRAVD